MNNIRQQQLREQKELPQEALVLVVVTRYVTYMTALPHIWSTERLTVTLLTLPEPVTSIQWAVLDGPA
jgi:hypothetical protein